MDEVKKLIKWDEMLKDRALYLYTHQKDVVYMYACKGQRLTEDLINYFYSAYPEHFAKYTKAELDEIKANSIGKIGYDCSGFVGAYCIGDNCYSLALIEKCSNKTSNIASGVAGSILFTTYGGAGRHVGIDTGLGYCVDMAYESTNDNIKNGLAGVRYYRIKDGITPWEVSGQHPMVDYEGANSR